MKRAEMHRPDTIMERATVIPEGENQTVCLPKGFHFSTTTVGLRHDGEAIALEPQTAPLPTARYFRKYNSFVSDQIFPFAAASGKGDWHGSVSFHQRTVSGSAPMRFMSASKSLPVYSR